MRKLYEPYVIHSGGGRSKAVEPLPAPPNILIAVPACFAFEYGAWESEQSARYDQSKAWCGRPYGTDIHISGPNPRIQAVRNTWAKDVAQFSNVTLKFFYGRPPEDRTCQGVTGGPYACSCHPKADEVFLDCPDDYEHLPQKTQAICRWALEHNFPYLFKCDDDSYVWIGRLVRELIENPPFDYAGWESGPVCSGGPGYWLSKRAMEHVVRYTPRGWAEDQMVGQAMSAANIKPTMLPNHKPGFAAHYFDLDKVTPELVCIHAVRPEDMYKLHEV